MARLMFVISYATTYVLIALLMCLLFGVDTDGWPYYTFGVFVGAIPAGIITWHLRQKRNRR